MSELPTHEPEINGVLPQSQQVNSPEGGSNQPGQYGYGFPPPAENSFGTQQGDQFIPVNAANNKQNKVSRFSGFSLKLACYVVAGVEMMWGLYYFHAACIEFSEESEPLGGSSLLIYAAGEILIYGLLPISFSVLLIFGVNRNSATLCYVWIGDMIYLVTITFVHTNCSVLIGDDDGSQHHTDSKTTKYLLIVAQVLMFICLSTGIFTVYKFIETIKIVARPQTGAAEGGWDSGANQPQVQFPEPQSAE